MLQCIGIVANLRNKRNHGPLFEVLNRAMSDIEDARFAAIREKTMDDHTDDLARTDAPERIWVDFAESPSGAMIGSVHTSDLGDIPHPRHRPCGKPRGQALLREAEARGRDAGIDDAMVKGDAGQTRSLGRTDDLLDWIAPGRTLITEAAALRAGRGERRNDQISARSGSLYQRHS